MPEMGGAEVLATIRKRPDWADLPGLLDETWYLDVDPATRRERLVHRHEQHGKTHAEAEAWTDGSDEANARLIAATRARADLRVLVRGNEC